ncbi:hypothetical protein OZ411_40360 [Bradyrhizobium sp. Arg237L]|uniref:hypothetical protein n=1 Tax=Bradyrhizobium sp. Arg237L TaxID=3003352 RepID=UPI00249E596F|nr:hypothetical protein [Bradyrhizobium sp. Arg237L]MDI4239046.1 hypothetical protein [Bradyrhizobium sp. Arg237L]
MKRLILTSSSGYCLMRMDLAEAVIPFTTRLVWGPLPFPDSFATYVAARSEQHGPGSHWSDFVGEFRNNSEARKDLALVDFCEPYKTVELWFDPGPDDQLQLISLLDFFRSHPETVAKLRLLIVDFDLLMMDHEGPAATDVRKVDVTEAKLETGSMSWQAYRAPTPEACFNLLGKDLSALPLLRTALIDLLEELPSSTTGLGATEMRLLELIAAGYRDTNSLFHLRGLRQRRVFKEWEIGSLLEGLAHGPTPAVAGLDDELRTLRRDNYRGRGAAYKRSRLSLTKFGKAVLAHKEDFSHHNRIDRWWGGTHLTNDNLWRWNPGIVAS